MVYHLFVGGGCERIFIGGTMKLEQLAKDLGATLKGPRFTVPGKMKVHSGGLSTTLTGTPASRQSSDTRLLTSASSLAEMTRP